LERAFGGYLVLHDLEFEAGFQAVEDWIKIMTMWPNMLIGYMAGFICTYVKPSEFADKV
jgi:hypothetical protein